MLEEKKQDTTEDLVSSASAFPAISSWHALVLACVFTRERAVIVQYVGLGLHGDLRIYRNATGSFKPLKHCFVFLATVGPRHGSAHDTGVPICSFSRHWTDLPCRPRGQTCLSGVLLSGRGQGLLHLGGEHVRGIPEYLK